MNRNEAIELLTVYNDFLMDHGYADDDMVAEKPTAIEGFLNEKWAKINLPLKDKEPFNIGDKVVIDGTLYATIEKIEDDKIWFKDGNQMWYLDTEDAKLSMRKEGDL